MNDHGSALVGASEKAWGAIQVQHPEVPDVVMRLGVSTGSALGHFAEHRLSLRGEGGLAHEVMLSARRLRDGGAGAFSTLLHEAVHASCSATGIQDTSRQGRYHNRRFQKCAVAFGMTCEHHSSTYGLAHTDLTVETSETYQEEISQLDAVIVFYEKHDDDEASPTKTRIPAAKAECECNRKIPASALDTGPIICGVCECEFLALDTSDPDEEN